MNKQDEHVQMGRKLIVDRNPNKLFLKYLAEWRDEARSKEERAQFIYSKAYKSLKKYPLPLQCGEEAKILENFGDKICKMLDDKLSREASEEGITTLKYLERSRKVPESWWKKINNDDDGPTKKVVKPKRKKPKMQQRKEETVKEAAKQTIAREDAIEFADKDVVVNSPGFVLKPGQFKIILLVDTRETMGEAHKVIRQELEKQTVQYEQRTLQLGDFLWVAQETNSSRRAGDKPRELVLDYIIERKILSDLAMSIRDGRFREQKIRLKQSSLNRIIYLIENMREIGNQSLPEQTLRQASYNTQIVDNIFVKYTEDAKSTVRYLKLVTKKLQSMYETQTLISRNPEEEPNRKLFRKDLIPYDQFSIQGSKLKKLTVKEMFLRHLMQVHGLSHDKASAIVTIYPTPSKLITAYRQCSTSKEMNNLLSTVKFGITQRNIGSVLSRTLCKIYTNGIETT